MMIEKMYSVDERRAERGANVVVEIRLIRHPEKDPETGDITDQGKADFLDFLEKSIDVVEEGAHQKIYLSPHKRPQQLVETAEAFLHAKGMKSAVRTRKELLPLVENLTPESMEQLRQKAIDEGLLSPIDPILVSQSDDARSDPSEKFERVINSLALEEYYNANFPGTGFSGEDIGGSIDGFIRHLSLMSRRLRSGTRLQTALVSHSGIIEFFIKRAYLSAHPGESPESVTTEKIGGLLGFLEGACITIRTDGVGTMVRTFQFRDMQFEF